ncbi:uncharacterized protein LOC134533887 isoform X2 [Bacillus rossius redtenbacheri]|uniref:uncharacterized protein LOC134533887 isoform X2 n=1 Tax=Bacillus rossius redtenbacheri TaxID=93214 RepID=UPI002FDCF518
MATGDGRKVENLTHATKEFSENYPGNINELRSERNGQLSLETPLDGGVAVSTPILHSEESNANDAQKDTFLEDSDDDEEGFSFTATDSTRDLTLSDSDAKVLKRKRSGDTSCDEDDSESEEIEDEGISDSPNDSRSSPITTHATVELSQPGKKKSSPADEVGKLLSLERGLDGGRDTSKTSISSENFIHNESRERPEKNSAKAEDQISGSHSIDTEGDGDGGAEELDSDGSGAETDVEDNASDSRSVSSVQAAPDPDIDRHLPDTVTLLTTPEGAKVYLVGTAHFSTESQEDVAMIIRAVQPHVVLVELCQSRVNILQLDEKTILEEAKNINLEKIQSTIKQNGLFQGVMYLLLLSMSAHLTKQLGMAPGGEFRRAFSEAKRVPSCLVHLGDRPIQITLKRALASLSWWQTLRLTWHLLMSKEPISKEEIERCKRRDLLEEMLAEMAGEFPALGTVFVNERDVYLAHSLQLAATPVANSPKGPVPARVVGVVGIGHVPGIVQNWGKVSLADIPPIMQLPPPSLSGRVVKFTAKASCVCVVVWGISKLLPQSSLGSLKSSVQGLFSA